jgi:tRNA pseudouridine13 synthase
VKHLTEEDLGSYTIQDVILPMPGWNVEYPEGAIGKMYQDMLAADGLDANRMRRDQRYVCCSLLFHFADPSSEYSLPGSYRKVIHMPTNVSWEHIRYTDPDLPLSQSDEDRILGFNPPAADDPEGKFRALSISWTLGTSSYATMALREITRQETATWNQISLTLEGEDQAHKGTGKEA